MDLVLKKNSMSCFRLIQTAAAFSLLLTMLLSPRISFGGPQSPAVVGQDDRAAEVDALIRDLQDPKFVVREIASQKLADIGKPAVEALKLAVKSESLEVQVRSKSILSGILLDRSSEFKAGEQQMIKQFMSADVLGRTAILRAEATARNTRLFLRLLDICVADEEDDIADEEGGVADGDIIESAIEELIALEANNPLTQWVGNLMITQRWDELNTILNHPGILKYSPMLRTVEARNAGEFEAYVDGLFEAFTKSQAAEETFSERELVSLVGLLRVRNDFDRAKKVIAALPGVELQRKLFSELLFQQGDWKEILRRTKLEPADADFILANPLQRSLLHHLLGDQTGVAEIEQELRQELQAAIEAAGEENAGPVKLLETELRILGAVTLNWPLINEFLDADNLANNVQLMFALNRPDKGLELLELGPSFNDRQTWVKDTLKVIVDARKAIKKKLRGQRDDDYNRLEKTINDSQQLLGSIVDLVEQWGLDDEAQLYSQMIFAGSDSSDTGAKEELMERLIAIGRTKEYWEMAGRLLTTSERHRYSSRSWFGIADSEVKSHASQWASRIRGAIVDPVEEAKTMAAIMNSPSVEFDEMDFDLDFELARFRTRSMLDATGGDEYLIGKVLELHGKDEAAAALLKQSVQLGHPAATRSQFYQAMASEDPYGILKAWTGGTGGMFDTCLIAEEAALEVLETESDAEKIRAVKKQIELCQLAIAAQWTGGSHWSHHSISRLGELEKSHLAILRLQCFVYGVPGNFVHKAGQHQQLADALATDESNAKYQGAVELATIMFDELGYAATARTDIGWSFTAVNLNIALGKGLVERKEYELAADFLLRTAKFSPGDVSVGEGTIKKLTEAGESEAADQIYQAVGKHFVETLKDYPDSPLARNNFAWLSAVSQRDLESARRHVAVAVKMRPHVQQYWDTFSELEFLLGNSKEAYQMSKRCIQLSPARIYYRRQKERFRKAMGE